MGVSLALALLVSSAPARVAVVPIVGADDRLGVTGIVRVVQSVLDEYIELSSLGLDEVYSPDGTTLMSSVALCGDDAPCVRNAVRKFGADLGFVVVLNRRIQPPILQVELVSGTRAIAHVRSDPLSVPEGADENDELRRLAHAVVDKAGFERGAKIEIVTNPPDSTVLIDLTPQAVAARHSKRVVAGPHRIEVSRDGYKPFVAERTLLPGELWNVEARLDEQASVTSSPWLWVGAATVVVAAAVVTGIVLSSGGPTDLCITSPDYSGGC